MINQAIQAFQIGDLNSTEIILNRVLAAHSKNLPALHILGLVKASQSKHKEAAELLKRAIRLNPNDPSLHYNLAKALQESGAHKESLPHHKKAVELNPTNPEAWLNYGKSLSNLGFNVDALDVYQNSLQINPNFTEAFLNIGATLKDLERYDEALNYADKAISINPMLSGAWSNRGIALKELKRYDEALASYDKAISLKPDYHEAWSNRGVTLNELKRYDEALASYDKAISLKPDYFDAYWNQALSHLVTGNFESGWKNYEYRWKKIKAEPMRHQQFALLTNLNEISGKSVLVWGEQGYGDTIQFSRFIEKLIELKADVIFEVQEPLKALLQNSFPHPKIISQKELTGVIDFQIPLLSLPLLFSTNFDSIPSKNSYIRADEENLIFWRNKLNLTNKKMNVGVACSGNKNHLNDKNRSMDLRFFKPIADKVNLFLIQKDLREKDQEFLSQYQDIKFLGKEIKSFNDSASIIQAMDLVITVDTSLAHLSGALGKPTLILLPWNPEWRWLLDRQDSPWYPTAKLFRQTNRDNWEAVIKEVILHLNLDY
jgi:tetratricopeptide (TPR) repeat protein